MKTEYVFLLVCLVGYLLTQIMYLQYQGVYGIPFGMHDIDDYLFWLGFEREFSTVFKFPDTVFGVDIFHIFYLENIRFLGWVFNISYIQVFTFFNPFVLWFLLPCSILFFSSSLLDGKEAFVLSFFYLFGSNILFLGGFCGLYSFVLGIIFFNFSIGFLNYILKGVNLYVFFFVSAFLCVLYYPIFLGAFLVVVYGWLIRGGYYRVVGVLSFSGLVLFVFLFLNGFAMFRGSVAQADPSFQWFVFHFINPVLLFFCLFGFFSVKEMFIRRYYFWFLLVFVLVSPFMQLFRTLIIIYPFICYFGVLGLRRYVLWLLWLLLGVWFVWEFNFFLGLMVDQFFVVDSSFNRMLDPLFFLDLIRGWGFSFRYT